MGGFALLVIALWFMRGATPAAAPSVVTTAARDPFASQRAKTTAKPGDMVKPAEEGMARPFLDAPGRGATAYMAGDYATALGQYRAAVERNPQDAESLSNLGQVLVRMNKADEAIQYFERAVSILPDRWAYQFNLARALGLVGRLDDSVTAYRRAQQLFPDDYVTTFNLALTLHKRGDDEGAVEQYQKAIALQPEDASFRLALATSLERLQKRSEAAAAYQEYLRLSPSGPDADKVRARIAELTAG
jgi:tetratricopeptide (TPR) repeat protein